MGRSFSSTAAPVRPAALAAPPLLLFLLLGLLGAAAANVGDSCSTSADCGAGQWCFDCEPQLSGSHCVRSAATNPFQLINNSLPFNKYAYLTTHNAYAIVGEPSHTGIPRVTFDNQEDTVTDQLNVMYPTF
ncbi:PLC-like phosphodiesterases superfamily protein [Zea mays]|uniref:PLC-like phosphodiesterases superfamily protein n=1 Tax=Zea mays TaxID=4577 RepID=A0A1D6P894_MAIZE|nr:PLC-like phosphodiesterases superfamily protein [Zea mays]